MYYRKRIAGLEAGADYGVTFQIGFATATESEAVVLGEIRTGNPGCDTTYGLGTLGDGLNPLTVSAGNDGSIGLFFGEESVLEIAHELYYTTFEAVFEPI